MSERLADCQLQARESIRLLGLIRQAASLAGDQQLAGLTGSRIQKLMNSESFENLLSIASQQLDELTQSQVDD